MSFGVSQLESTITGVTSASQSLREDIRFLPFYYWEPDYSEISATIRNQMKEYLDSLMFPLTLVTDWSLQFNDHYAITPYRFVSTGDALGYYPESFRVDDLTYEEWENLLVQNNAGFLPVRRINTSTNHYNALIYSLPWVNNSYLYVCLNVDEVKQTLIDKSDLDSFYLTIERSDGTCLYTDLSDEISDYHSVTQKTSTGNLVITVHIPKTALTARMNPLYLFLGLYLVICTMTLIIAAYVWTHLSSKPLLKIVNMLEGNSPTPVVFSPDDRSAKLAAPLHSGFHYIQNKLYTYENNLNAYRRTIETQAKVLQARFLEKAVHGSLAADKDYESFFSYFPNFPESFCLVLVGLSEKPSENETVYPEPLSLIQTYLQGILPDVYQQQLNDSELLLIIDEEDFSDYSSQINRLITNINREEPCYHAWGVASKFYHHPKSIPSAFWQIQDLNSQIAPKSLASLCMVSDHQAPKRAGFQMADAMSIHSAITYGNKEMALLKLQSYSNSLNAKNRPVYEMIRSILLCIKQEYADQLIDVDIPPYHARLDMYAALEKIIGIFCDELQELKKQTESDPFTQEVKDYIDLHFTEDDLGYTKLADHFRCSPSKIQKAFARELDITISGYIEKKRMELANELLANGEHTVSEIARKCGFTNKSTFHKAYVRVFGHTPKSMK